MGRCTLLPFSAYRRLSSRLGVLVLLSDATSSAWAKSDRDGGSLSLVRHLADSVAVAGLVWDRWLPERTKQVISACLPGGLSDGRLLVRWLAGVHDIGKLTPAFACQVPALAEVMHDKGLSLMRMPSNRAALPHGLAGDVELQRFLRERGWDKKVARTYSVVVGSHHGKPPARGELVAAPTQLALLGDRAWARSREELLEYVAAKVGVVDRLPVWREVPLSVTVQVLVTAVVIVSDWIASNQDLFPLDSARASSTAAVEAWRVLGLPAPWVPELELPVYAALRDSLFRSRFELSASSVMRPLQAVCVQVACEVAEPGVMVVEAPMGEGKTEAALLAAEVLAARFGLGGVFVALPTMATSDAMFGRVRRWVDRLPGAPGSLFLAHGKAALNPVFAQLKRRGFASIGTDCGDSGVVAHSWFVGKKGPLANIVVGTIDQVLRGALKSRHVMLRHLGLANKVVVVDEVHAADSYMSTYLCRCLEWLGAYGVPVILLSATLPPAQRRLLVAAYQRGRLGAADSEGAESTGDYPRVTVWPPAPRSIRVESSGRRGVDVRVERIGDDVADVVATVREALADGGVVGIVCNTVARAQQTFDALRADPGFGDDELLLVHSRFVASHRAVLEDRLRALLGPPGEDEPTRPRRFVVVGTQVIEQSLDIDVDLLITDLAPIDLLLQRIGRLHRHERGNRPAGVTAARCLLRGAQWSAVPPVPDRGSVAVYQSARLLRAAAVLDTHGDLIRIPSDVPGLVERAYADSFTAPPGWGDAVAEAEEKWEAFQRGQQDKAAVYLLRGPHSDQATLHDWLTADVPEEAGPGGQAQVRDAEDTIEAIVVQRKGDDVHVLDTVPDVGGRVVPTLAAPDPQTAKALAACTIRLPAMLTRYGRMGAVIQALEDTFYPGWQQTPWLAGELVLELDEDYRAELAGHRLRYDPVLGLLIEPKDNLK
ncbi:CRISPR-associated helicase Cas3' [Nocardia terpenica]|uniref:CRISPR-associated helicase Cas3' n=1 Tax=Nocardia terpenica TaxID=455432 RepID=UPI002FDF413F